MGKSAAAKERLLYHIIPPQGLLNDPNGLVYFRGRHHVFFQWNQTGTVHLNKSWGHVSTGDLIDWQMHPPALEPGDWFDKDGCYSGSAVVHEDRLYLFYTGNVRGENGERDSYQCLAVSDDGIHFEKRGPVIGAVPGYTAHIRDPKVWKEADGRWRMVLGAQNERLQGTALLFASRNLTEWQLEGEVMKKGLPLGYMWECPDLIRLVDQVEERERGVFIFSPQGIEPERERFCNLYQTGYLVGTLPADGPFQPETEFDELDRGFEFYAPQTYRDAAGRLILFGWLGMMQPEDEQAFPTVQDNWIHALTIPRQLKLADSRLLQQPLEEWRKLRQEPRLYEKEGSLEIRLDKMQNEILWEWPAAAPSFCVSIREEVEIVYKEEERRLVVARTNWRTRKREERSVRLAGPLQQLQLFMENTSLELFLNQGEETFTLRYVAPDECATLRFDEAGEGRSGRITVYPLRPLQGLSNEKTAPV